MRRTPVLLAVAGLCAVAFCAGRAVKLKFPWAGDALNRPCGKTELEWRCVSHRISPPKSLGIEWQITHFVAEPKQKGLRLQVNLGERGKVSHATAMRALSLAKRRLFQDHLDPFLKPTMPKDPNRLYPEASPFHDWKNVCLEVYVNGKISERRGMTAKQLGRSPG